MRTNNPKLATSLRFVAILVILIFTPGCGDDDGGGKRPAFANPEELTSVNGELATVFQVAMAQTRIDGQNFTAPMYNAMYTPPTLRVNQGDVIKLRLVNEIDLETNLHYHGMLVSPLGNSDNVFVHVPPMSVFEYEIDIPDNHPQGLFYYHPHQYGTTESQIMGGMSGLLVVEGLLDPFPQLAGIREQLMVLRDTQIENGRLPDDIDASAPTNFTLNGLVNPTIDIQPGEVQLWRIGNLGADLYYQFQLEGHLLYEVARDGNRHNQLVARDVILLPPSARVEVLVVGGQAGKYPLRSFDFNTGPAGDSYPGTTLATMVVGGDAVAPVALPTDFPPVEDLRNIPDPPQRTIVFSEDPSGSPFFINGKMFDANRVDTTVELGTVEEWTIYNCTQELHVFHIHQVDFQVVAKSGPNGDPNVDFIGYQDTVNVPIATGESTDDENCETGTPGWVKVLIPFNDPTNVGKFVYHCHIGEHEDNGMMATIEVVDPALR